MSIHSDSQLNFVSQGMSPNSNWLGFILIAVLHIPTAHTLVACTQDACTPRDNQCIFYSDCLEKAIPCGNDGYALGFGLLFCSKFMEQIQKFSPQGREWVQGVALCLQKALLPKVCAGASCDEIKSFAIASHAKCYTSPGSGPSICKIPKSDWVFVLFIIKNKVFDPSVLKTMYEVAKTCVFHNNKLHIDL